MGLFGGGPATVDVNSGPDTSDQQPAPSAPIFALDQLKYAGVDVQNQISPYLQVHIFVTFYTLKEFTQKISVEL